MKWLRTIAECRLRRETSFSFGRAIWMMGTLAIQWSCLAADQGEAPAAADDLSERVRAARESLFREEDPVTGKIRAGDSEVGFKTSLQDGYVEIIVQPSETRIRVPVKGIMTGEEFSDGSWQKNASLNVGAGVPGTPLLLEDLTFRFLFWSDFELAGTEPIRGKPCSIIRFRPSPGQSAYARVDLWVEDPSNTPMRSICYSENGQELRRFDPIKIVRVGDEWVIRVLRVFVTAPGGIRQREPTYIEFDPK